MQWSVNHFYLLSFRRHRRLLDGADDDGVALGDDKIEK